MICALAQRRACFALRGDHLPHDHLVREIKQMHNMNCTTSGRRNSQCCRRAENNRSRKQGSRLTTWLGCHLGCHRRVLSLLTDRRGGRISRLQRRTLAQPCLISTRLGFHVLPTLLPNPWRPCVHHQMTEAPCLFILTSPCLHATPDKHEVDYRGSLPAAGVYWRGRARLSRLHALKRCE